MEENKANKKEGAIPKNSNAGPKLEVPPAPKKHFAEKLTDKFMSIFQTKPKGLKLSDAAKKALEKEPENIFKIKLVEDIPPIPEMAAKENLDVRYPVIEPYAYIHVFWDDAIHELVYSVEEPKLTPDEEGTLKLIEEGLIELINISFVSIKSTEKVIEFLEKNVRILMEEFGIRISKEVFLKLMYYIYRDFIGMGRIEPLMRDYFIEDIECNGSKTPIYLVHRKYKHVRTNIAFPNNEELTRFVEKLAQKCGKYISYAEPLLDGALPDGSRINATYTQDISSRGPTFTVRKFTIDPWTPIKLMEFRTVSPEIIAYLWLLVEYGSNIMVIGGTGSGKTSFLNALAFFIPPSARIVSIEDTRELNLRHENWLPSVSRAGAGATTITGERHGEVNLFDLLKESFRQRPDYIIVGEIRGKEAFVLFQGMASGHPSMGTMHAEDVWTMVQRLETPPISLSSSLVEAMDVVCVMIHAKVKGKEVRRVKEIVEIVKIGDTEEQSQLNVPFARDPATDKFYFKTESVIFKKIMESAGLTEDALLNEFKRRSKLLMAMYKKQIFSFSEVQDVIHSYYKVPEAVLKKFGVE